MCFQISLPFHVYVPPIPCFPTRITSVFSIGLKNVIPDDNFQNVPIFGFSSDCFDVKGGEQIYNSFFQSNFFLFRSWNETSFCNSFGFSPFSSHPLYFFFVMVIAITEICPGFLLFSHRHHHMTRVKLTCCSDMNVPGRNLTREQQDQLYNFMTVVNINDPHTVRKKNT